MPGQCQVKWLENVFHYGHSGQIMFFFPYHQEHRVQTHTTYFQMQREGMNGKCLIPSACRVIKLRVLHDNLQPCDTCSMGYFASDEYFEISVQG